MNKKTFILILLCFTYYLNNAQSNKIIPIISWGSISDITFGTTLSDVQLNATSNVPGVFVYNPSSDILLGAGQQNLSADFIPNDTSKYQTLRSITNKININKVAATITLSNLIQKYDGSGKKVNVSTSPVNISSTVLYNNNTILPVLPGKYQVSATINDGNFYADIVTDTLTIDSIKNNIQISNLSQQFEPGVPKPVTILTQPAGLSVITTYNGSSTIPTNAGQYQVISTINDSVYTGSDTSTLIINKSIPTIQWNNPNPIAYGTPLSSQQLNYSSTVSGQWSSNGNIGDILNAGSHVLFVMLIPDDTANYVNAYKTINLIINKLYVNLVSSNYSQYYDSTAKKIYVSPSDIYGIKITYNGVDSAVKSGTYNSVISLINSNYTSSSINKVFTINKSNPVINWDSIGNVNYGTILSYWQLNAKSSTPGTFSYYPASGIFLQPGKTTLSVTFTPNNNNYNSVSVINFVTSANNSEYPQYFISNTIVLY